MNSILWLAELVRKYGCLFDPVPWITWNGRGYEDGRERYCFSNAWDHASQIDRGLPYVEGFASYRYIGGTSQYQWIPHAWCVDAEGRVVDPTWREGWAGALPIANWQYFGVWFETPFVSCHIHVFHEGNDPPWRWGILDVGRRGPIERHLAERGESLCRRPPQGFLKTFDPSVA